MSRVNLDSFVYKSRLGKLDRYLGGLAESGRFTTILHTNEVHPPIILLAEMLRLEEHEHSKVLDFKGSLTQSFIGNDLDLSHSSHFLEKIVGDEAMSWAISWAETQAEPELHLDVLMLAGLDGIGTMTKLGADRDFVSAMSDCPLSGNTIIATAEIRKCDLTREVEAALQFSDRVFVAERVWPAPLGAVSVKFRNLTDRYRPDRAIFTYSGSTMTEKLGSMLR